MTDMLQRMAPHRAPDTLGVDELGVDDPGGDDLGCGCCTRPPTAVADRVAALQARRDALERQLQGLSPTN
jgi:hypothetical protein